jgi:xanthine dehydrogenase accessory factor
MEIDILRAIAAAHEPVSLVTILATRGSVPRESGSAMLVGSRGLITGSVGGGKGELVAAQAARRDLADRRSEMLTVEMMGAEAEGSAPVCGGTSRMLIEFVAGGGCYAQALALLESGLRALVIRKLAGALGDELRGTEVSVFDQNGAPVCGPDVGPDTQTAARCMRTGEPFFDVEKGLFYDPSFPEEKLLVLGAGHVGRAVAALASTLGFRVTVVDDREELLAAGRFPVAVTTVCRGYGEAVEQFPFDASTYVVIVTPGHLHDLECMRAVLSRTYRYVGCIGSMRKTRLLLDQLKKDGYDPEKVEGLCAPIGLDIGAETPAEIAVSIMGECIAVRRNAASLAGMTMARRSRRGGAP